MLKEAFTGWTLTAKSIATALIIAGLAVTGLGGSGSGANSTASLSKFGNLPCAVCNRWRNVAVAILGPSQLPAPNAIAVRDGHP
jgi:hypothetical protein